MNLPTPSMKHPHTYDDIKHEIINITNTTLIILHLIPHLRSSLTNQT